MTSISARNCNGLTKRPGKDDLIPKFMLRRNKAALNLHERGATTVNVVPENGTDKGESQA